MKEVIWKKIAGFLSYRIQSVKKKQTDKVKPRRFFHLASFDTVKTANRFDQFILFI